jgi:ATP-dependent DNA ligase
VCDQGLEGVVAKRSASTYRPGQRGWVKVKNPGYWRREQEIAAVKRSLERRPTAL